MKLLKVSVENVEPRQQIKASKRLSKQEKDIILKELPDMVYHNVSFELHNTYSKFANMIRRVLWAELPTYSFSLEDSKIDTSDVYILYDNLIKQIQAIPLNQEINYEGVSISLEVENKTADAISVNTDDIKVIKNNKNIVGCFVPGVELCKLKSMQYIKIDNIKISKGYGYEDYNAYRITGPISYKPHHTPLDEDTNTGVSSLVSSPTSFTIKYITHFNTHSKPLFYLHLACDELQSRLKFIKDQLMTAVQEGASSSLQIEESEDGEHKIIINGESETIIQAIIHQAIELTDNNIKFIAGSVIHPEKRTAFIRITHNQYDKILLGAIDTIYGDLEYIKKELKM